jgi:hypothetical protein
LRPDYQRAAQSCSDIAEGGHQASLDSYAEIGVLVGNVLGQLVMLGFDGLPPLQQGRSAALLSHEYTTTPSAVQTMLVCYAVTWVLLRGFSFCREMDCSLILELRTRLADLAC